ncbi:class I SAM-dependent methyltransferase [Actinospica sp.]|uniref:class I SAM-dependent DNA methyltransferase n=1 Tax=Actinospica sp. TaxID=1872142 RepID=UPI002BEFC304|nr:class I SAM-dependent methyltransferase [Actinospica sp.]HWG26261.1 class I SAM-dependent methyltransferase [Actinospica sp.]
MSDTTDTPDTVDATDTTGNGFLTATRAAYDTVAVSYADLLADHLAQQPFDRAVLALYAELVGAADSGDERQTDAPRVVEVGCGPGRVTAHLAGLGLAAAGIDLSPAMVDEARRRHRGISFTVGSMTALDLPDHQLDGLVAWYSVIHVPPAEHRAVYRGFHRALTQGGHLLLAFQVGDERRVITDAYGHSGLRLDAYRLQPDRVEDDLAAAGFEPVARLTRAQAGPEKTGQAYVIARAEQHAAPETA